jgi:hypothetical protein
LPTAAIARGVEALDAERFIQELVPSNFDWNRTPIQLKKILQAKAPDLSLEANDILVIPSSAGKILAGRTLEAAMQAATLVSVTAIP